MKLRIVIAAALVAVVVVITLAGRYLRHGGPLATGYAAKQLCSGVFVAGLPVDFVVKNDIGLAMSVLGPLLPSLQAAVTEPGVVRASFLGMESAAVYTGEGGCVLNPGQEFEVVPRELPPGQFGGASRVVPPPAALRELFDAAFTEPVKGQRRTLALLVIHRGKLIAERYAEPVTAATPMQGWSMNKSLMATWIGLQVEQGRLSLETPIGPLVASVDPELARRIDPDLDLSNLLHMESGFAFEETYLPGDDATRMLYRSPAMWRVAPGNGHAYPPGKMFNYSSGDTNLAAWVWTRSLGDETYTDWLRSRFAGALGLGDFTSEPDASGIQVGSSYTYMTARDWGRVGQLWLDAWHGRSELLSQEWMHASTQPRPSNTRTDYGRGFWLNAGGDTHPNLPTKLFYASGHNGQYVMVLPDEELVVVRLGLSSSGQVSGFEAFLEGLLKRLPALYP